MSAIVGCTNVGDMNTTPAAVETHTCTCASCKGLKFTCPTGYLADLSPRDYVAAVHNYAAHAHGSLARVFARKGINAA